MARRGKPVRRAAPPAPKKEPAAVRAAASLQMVPVVGFGHIASMSAVPGPEVTASLTSHMIRRLKGEGVTVAMLGERTPDRTLAASIQQTNGQCVLRMSLYDNSERRVTRRLKRQGPCTEAGLKASIDSMTGQLALRPSVPAKKTTVPDEPWAAGRHAKPVASLEDHPRAPF